VFATERDGPMAGMVQFLPNKRLGAILVISPQPQYLRRAETWIRRLDAQAQGSEKQLFTYSVQNRRAQELVDVLQSMFSDDSSGASQKRNVAPNYQETSTQSVPSSQSSGSASTLSGITSAIGSTSGGFGSGAGSGSRTSSAAASAPMR
jgi:general secretion pathway protein D